MGGKRENKSNSYLQWRITQRLQEKIKNNPWFLPLMKGLISRSNFGTRKRSKCLLAEIATQKDLRRIDGCLFKFSKNKIQEKAMQYQSSPPHPDESIGPAWKDKIGWKKTISNPREWGPNRLMFDRASS